MCFRMRVTTIRSNGLAALSYYVSSDGKAMVIDPRRDASIYYDLASNEKAEITQIFETHRNEDLVIGSLELQAIVPGAEISHSNATPFRYGDNRLTDGETFTLGMMRVTCLNTPGHTDDSMCFAVSDLAVGGSPIMVFTGDTLFVNEVGRTDLVDKRKHGEMSRKLYYSLHEKLLSLGDGVIVHPGHGAGSVCGGAIGDREISTIGFERKNNSWLKMSEDEFVESKIQQRLTLAPYFKHCEQLNTQGPPVLSAADAPQELNSELIESLLQEPNHRVLDTRLPGEFMKEHIPKTISLSLSNMGLIAGWALKPDQSFSLILENRTDLGEAWSYLVRVGFDNIVGFLANGITLWKDSCRAVDSIKSISPDYLKTNLQKRNVRVVDVREPHEFDSEHIHESISSPLTQLQDNAPSIGVETPVAAACPSGFRSTTAASILKRTGFVDVSILMGGLKAWKALGFPMES